MMSRIDLPEEADDVLKPGMRYHTLLTVVKPCYERLPTAQWAAAPISQGVVEAVKRAEGRFKDKKKPAEAVTLLTPVAITKDNLQIAERLSELK